MLVQDALDLVTRKLIKAKQAKQLVSQLKPNKPSKLSVKQAEFGVSAWLACLFLSLFLLQFKSAFINIFSLLP